MDWTYFSVYTQAWWVVLLAYLGTLLLPVLIGGLYLSDLIERLRNRNASILNEREARR